MTTPTSSGQGNGNEDGYGLPAIFAALRHDLIAAQDQLRDQNQQPLLKVSSADVELSFTLDSERKGGGGVNLKFFGVGFEGKGEIGRKESTVHKLKISLGPATGANVDVLGNLPPAE